MVSDKAFKFHMCIPWGKTFCLVPRSKSPVQVKYQSHSLQKLAIACAFLFHKHILLDLKFSLKIKQLELSIGKVCFFFKFPLQTDICQDVLVFPSFLILCSLLVCKCVFSIDYYFFFRLYFVS